MELRSEVPKHIFATEKVSNAKQSSLQVDARNFFTSIAVAGIAIGCFRGLMLCIVRHFSGTWEI